ncbi:MAG TPA: CoB--CoM heterodisulfide reductase iron-sulfur subunit B family protein [Ignavibacteria bacterium]|nr:heterodisulfide reductase subunit B [Bacteroidota bacterium]HRI84036.1 CoB--CoM heterodisulfide reductase iron-sulfur subunit B family protein [Ignavibacteria bacterium]HRJ99550.1 CoB--CoM heterodisulfide reductase iron-sulfur subunit B family protein [Ignavibacteria bacterium]
MRYGYFPGCSLTSSAKEYDISLRKVTDKLGITFEEINDWSCCGATSAHVTNHKLSAALAMRNIMLAGQQGLDNIIAPCAACYNRLIISQNEVKNHSGIRKETEDLLSVKFEKDLKIINILELFLKSGLNKITEKRKRELSGVKAACYYGCLLVRPAAITKFDDAEQPESMEKIVEATGAYAVDWNYKTECCGAAHSISRRDIVIDLSKKIIDDAIAHGANVLVVACPMCHTNLDMRQRAMKRKYPEHKNFPVLYLTELIGLSLGMDEKDLGIDLHYSNFKYADTLMNNSAKG